MLEEGAEAEVWEHWSSPDDEVDAVLNSVVELSVGQAATLRYVNTQDISEKSWIFATQRAQVERDGRLDWAALGFGSGRGKVRMDTKLAGPGSEARVTGGYAGGPGQHLDYDTTQEHAAPNTNSDLAFRGVLAKGSTAVWRGMIKVDPGAQQTDAFQESRNLLLSPEAHADAIPGLEILADDVRCTHAAAIAQVDKEQLFYLTSRGLDEAGREDAGDRRLPRVAGRTARRGPRPRRDLRRARAPPRRDPLAPVSPLCAVGQRRLSACGCALRLASSSRFAPLLGPGRADDAADHDQDRDHVEDPEPVADVGERAGRRRRSSSRSSRASHREQVEAEAGEGDHHREHPVLGAGGAAVVAPVDQGSVVGQGEAEDVAGEQRGDLDVPDDVRG